MTAQELLAGLLLAAAGLYLGLTGYHRRVGGIHFLRFGRLHISFAVSRRPTVPALTGSLD